jgi:hypothetical protein
MLKEVEAKVVAAAVTMVMVVVVVMVLARWRLAKGPALAGL